MKKFFILALALTFVAGIAYAEDAKYSFSGQYRWEMYNFTNEGFLDEDENKQEYFDQRFRLRAVFTPADGVTAVLRGDYAEDAWGEIGYRPNPGHDTIMIDEAYVDLTKGMFNIKAGLDGFGGFGNAMSTDFQGTNVRVSGNFEPVKVNAMWVKLSEGTQKYDLEDGDPSEDTDLMGAEVILAPKLSVSAVSMPPGRTKQLKIPVMYWVYTVKDLWAKLESGAKLTCTAAPMILPM
jgi:hypothetical protein